VNLFSISFWRSLFSLRKARTHICRAQGNDVGMVLIAPGGLVAIEKFQQPPALEFLLRGFCVVDGIVLHSHS